MKIIEFIKKSIDSICAKYIEGNFDEILPIASGHCPAQLLFELLVHQYFKENHSEKTVFKETFG